jgi:hypothetical protein
MLRDWTVTIPLGEILFWYLVCGIALFPMAFTFAWFYIRKAVSPTPKMSWKGALKSLLQCLVAWPFVLWDCIDFYRCNEPHRKREKARAT